MSERRPLPDPREKKRRQRVLAIDDSQDIHDLLDVRFRSEEIDIEHATSAAEGLERAAANPPDLILLDVDMPEITGFDVCQRLKADFATSEIPVIFLTGAGELYSKVHGFEVGAVDYVTKPFEAAELRARVRAALRTRRYQELLATRARIDGLTTLWNRDHFERALGSAIDAAEERGESIGLVMLDVDHFKSINDRFGHPFGDRVLSRIGELLWACLREDDVPCRYGGEEFACVLPRTSLGGAAAAAERIRARIVAEELVCERRVVAVSASCGVASTDQLTAADGPPARALVQGADEALYAAKREGRNRVCRAKVVTSHVLEKSRRSSGAWARSASSSSSSRASCGSSFPR